MLNYSREYYKMDLRSGRDEEKFALIIEDLKLLTDKQLDILRGFIVHCVNKNLLDEIKSILEDNENY